jgi:CubicO group peptidase (beta-lactamase class C family)
VGQIRRGTAAPVRPALMTTPSLPFARPEEVGLSSERLARLSEVMRAEAAGGRLPGAVVLIARRDRIAWLDSVGLRDAASGAPMTDDAIFRIYSMTKPIVSVATMMLVEEGRLMLGDPVGKYLPAFANQSVLVERDGRFDLEPAQRETTVHDLLRHTSGLTYEFLGTGPVHQRYVEARLGDRDRTAAELCDRLAPIPLLHQPGSAFAYGRSTDVLGRVLEVVSGRSLGEVLRERVLEPLRMTDTAFHVPARHHARVAEPFAHDPDTGAAVQLLDVGTPPALEMGGGGLVSTAMDYARFCQMLANGGTLDGERLISRKTLEWMRADHLGGIPIQGDQLSPGYRFGLGFAVRMFDGLAPFPGSAGQYHWGGIAGTVFWIDPRERMFAILMIQAPGQREYYRNLYRTLVHAAVAD